MDVSNYQPSPEVLDRLKKVKLVGVIGASGVGKSTLINSVLHADPNVYYVQTTTSRAIRPGEKDNVDYHFRTRKEILERFNKGELVQLAPPVFENLYATAPEDYSVTGISIMAIIAQAMPFFRSLPFQSIATIFITPPSFEEWQERMGARSFTTEQREHRFSEAKHSYEFALHDKATTILINDDVEKAKTDFLGLVRGHVSEEIRQYQNDARALISDILQHIK